MVLDVYDYECNNDAPKLYANIFKEDKNLNLDFIDHLFDGVVIDQRIRDEIIAAIKLMKSGLDVLETRTITAISSRIIANDAKTWLILTMHRGQGPTKKDTKISKENIIEKLHKENAANPKLVAVDEIIVNEQVTVREMTDEELFAQYLKDRDAQKSKNLNK